MTAPQLTSIIMVTFHTGPVLEAAIAAVMAQTADVELVLVNNGNPPEVEAVLVERFRDEPLVRLLTGHGNIGFGRACNLGARMAQGDRVLFLNPDSLLPPDAVARLHKAEQGLKRPFLLGARLLDEQGHDQRGCRRALLTPRTALIEALHLGRFFPQNRLNYHRVPLTKGIITVPAISGAFMYMVKEDFMRLKGFDEAFFLHVEDLDLCLNFRKMGGEIYFIPDLVVTHVGSTSKVSSLFIEKQKAKGFSLYFHKNYRDHASPVLLWMLDLGIWSRYALKILTRR